MDHSAHHMDSRGHNEPTHNGHMEHMQKGDFFNISEVMGNMMSEHMGHEGHNMVREGHNMGHEAHGMGHEGHGMGHEEHSSHSMMSMTFHGGYKEVILFSWWNVTDIGEFAGSFLAIFIMALFYEGLKYYRKHLLWKTYSGLQYCAVASPDKGVANAYATDEPQVVQPTMLSTAHAWQTVLHGLQVLVSYMLMLVFMTYNVWLCIAVVFGSATGFFLFGWRESVVVDFTEHCH